MPPGRPKKDTIIVAVDYGTTHSGVSYTYRGKPDASNEIPVVRGWQEGTGCDKVPTQLQYEVSSEATPLPSRKRRAAGSYADIKKADVHVVKWGFPASKDKDSIQMLKLLLDPQQELPPYVSRTRLEAQLKQIGRGAVEATADFLEKLKGQVLEALDKRYGKAFMATTKIDYILTVPAVWSDAAKDATLRAAEMAGLHKSRNLQMITEPEAAGLYALKQMEGVTLAEGDTYIVCDAGGGTVDLISYEIKSLDPLRFEECAPGTGGICGSGLLNMRFEEHVKSRMGVTAFEEYCEKNPKDWNRCVEHFEQRTKRDFNPHALQIDDLDDASVPLAGAKEDPRAGIEKNYIILDSENLHDIFRPVMDAIVKLCDEQYIALVKRKKKPKAIVLVGGLGESNHLHNVLKLHFAGIEDFEVLQPPNAWSAVARGAVIHCIEGDSLVEARIARHHYGVINRLPFEPDKHSRKNCFFDTDDETWYAENQVTWFVKKGESMPSGTPIVLPFHFPACNKLLSETITLVISNEEEAPMEFATTARTRSLGTIEVNLEKVAASRWKKSKTSSGKKFVSLDYKVGMLFGSGGLVFDMRVGDKLCGSLRAKYD
ncbi:actin-like ATPase domain-containing protein [Aureobasidium sp. EXF-10727]|nr:actin-like ATPase domain-containing protein [Aureobasidium sp. EXF-10727]